MFVLGIHPPSRDGGHPSHPVTKTTSFGGKQTSPIPHQESPGSWVVLESRDEWIIQRPRLPRIGTPTLSTVRPGSPGIGALERFGDFVATGLGRAGAVEEAVEEVGAVRRRLRLLRGAE